LQWCSCPGKLSIKSPKLLIRFFLSLRGNLRTAHIKVEYPINKTGNVESDPSAEEKSVYFSTSMPVSCCSGKGIL